MRVNVYAADLEGPVETVLKEKDGKRYIGVRLPISGHDPETQEPHGITLWQRDDARSKHLRKFLEKGIAALDKFDAKRDRAKAKAATARGTGRGRRKKAA